MSNGVESISSIGHSSGHSVNRNDFDVPEKPKVQGGAHMADASQVFLSDKQRTVSIFC